MTTKQRLAQLLSWVINCDDAIKEAEARKRGHLDQAGPLLCPWKVGQMLRKSSHHTRPTTWRVVSVTGEVAGWRTKSLSWQCSLRQVKKDGTDGENATTVHGWHSWESDAFEPINEEDTT